MPSAASLELGQPAVAFGLRGVDGRSYGLADVKGPSGLIVAFICNHCPYVRAQIDRLVRDLDELRRHGVGAVAIMPNDTAAYPEDRFEAMQAFSARHRFGFPYVIA